MKIEKKNPEEDLQEGISPTIKKSRIKTFPRSVVFLICLVVVLGVLTLFVYRAPLSNPMVRVATAVIPFPAAMVNGSTITLHDYAIERDAFFHYLESTKATAPGQEVVRQMILDALVNKVVIRQLASRYGVRVDRKRVDAYYEVVVQNEESEEVFKKQLEQTFGWNKTQFKKRIVESVVLALQVGEYVSSHEELQSTARQQIEEKQARLQKGEPFNGMDLGYLSVSALPKEWDPVKTLNVDQRTDILSSYDGYTILKVVDKTVDVSDTKLHLLEITVPKKTLEDFVKEYLAGARIRYFLK